ncbi:MAG: hypothetical protein AABZ39_15925 [Spirochaetota bacterium]
MKIRYSIAISACVVLISCAPKVSVAVSGADTLTNKAVVEGWKIYWSEGAAIAVNSMKESVTIFRDYNDEKDKKKNDGYWSSRNYTMLSIAGTIVCYRCDWYGEGGAHPSSGSTFAAVDLAEGSNEMLLTDVFTAEEIYGVLIEDPVIQKTLSGETPKNLNGVFSMADGGCEMDISARMLGSFAFHHVKDGSVAIRIGIPHGCETMRGNFTQIGFYLPIPIRYKNAFAAAVKNRTLMQNLAPKMRP